MGKVFEWESDALGWLSSPLSPSAANDIPKQISKSRNNFPHSLPGKSHQKMGNRPF